MIVFRWVLPCSCNEYALELEAEFEDQWLHPNKTHKASRILSRKIGANLNITVEYLSFLSLGAPEFRKKKSMSIAEAKLAARETTQTG